MSTLLTESDIMGDSKGPPAKKARSGELETPTVDAGISIIFYCLHSNNAKLYHTVVLDLLL